jgi:hypothetical protein
LSYSADIRETDDELLINYGLIRCLLTFFDAQLYWSTMNISELTVTQLERALGIKREIAALENELARIVDGSSAGTGTRRRMSAEGRARIAAAARARWARFHAAQGKAPKRAKKFTMSAAARAKIAAAARARWARVKAQK